MVRQLGCRPTLVFVFFAVVGIHLFVKNAEKLREILAARIARLPADVESILPVAIHARLTDTLRIGVLQEKRKILWKRKLF